MSSLSLRANKPTRPDFELIRLEQLPDDEMPVWGEVFAAEHKANRAARCPVCGQRGLETRLARYLDRHVISIYSYCPQDACGWDELGVER